MVHDGDVERSVGEVVDLTGVTVRLLHHYDEIGLVRPSGRSESGHRRYDDGDVARLRQVLTYRALGFSLSEVAAILDDPKTSIGTHLRRQHHLLTDQINRLRQVLIAVESALEANMSEQHRRIVPNPDQQVELVGEVTFPDDWAADVERRFGHAPEYEESAQRVAAYTTEDWRQIMEEEASLCTRLAEVMAAGAPPDSEAAMDLAEEHRNGLRRWFFDCTSEAHVAFADMFEADERMRKSFESVAAGLTDYLRLVIRANAERRGKATEG
ncbi:MAG: MerR family transcriptional regulator [Acidimicrobiales bacterium]